MGLEVQRLDHDEPQFLVMENTTRSCLAPLFDSRLAAELWAWHYGLIPGTNPAWGTAQQRKFARDLGAWLDKEVGPQPETCNHDLTAWMCVLLAEPTTNVDTAAVYADYYDVLGGLYTADRNRILGLLHSAFLATQEPGFRPRSGWPAGAEGRA